MAADDVARSRWSVLALAAGVWVLLDLVRAWTPTLITIVGQAAATPPENIGAFALGCALVPVAAVAALRRLRPVPVLTATLAVAVLARVLLQASPGGRPHLVVATIGVVAAMTWLALALHAHGRHAVTGLVSGVALSVVTHAALGTWGAVWRTDVWAWALLALQVALVAAAGRRARAVDGEGVPARLGWLVWPGLIVAGVVVANAGRASAVLDVVGLVLVAVGAVLGVAATLVRPTRATAIAAVVLLVGVVACVLLVTDDGVAPPWVAVCFLLGMPALAHVWAAADRAPRASRALLAVPLGGVVWVVLLFAYYAGYDLGYRADVVVVAAAAALGLVAALGRWPRAVVPARPVRPLVVGAGALVAAGLAAVGPGATITPVPTAQPAEGTTTVAAYNLRMGYGIDGRFRPQDVAEVLAQAQVSLLSEVDRGWYLNGGQDQLAILERLLGTTGWFGAAADPVWGDAVLLDADRVRLSWHPLPSHGAVTGAQALVVTPGGGELTYVATHLQPNDDGVTAQAADLAAVLSDVLAAGGPVVLGGDLNMVEGEQAYALVLGTGLVDADPGGADTSPAEAPEKRIDYVFATPDLTVADVRVPSTLASDHLPVLVTLATG